MTQLEKRWNEFINYHINGDGECNGIVLKSYADIYKLSKKERAELAYMFSVTYCVESSIVLYTELENIEKDVDSWIKKYKERIIFQSDRKYIRMKDSFKKVLLFYFCNKKEILKISEQDCLDLNYWIPVVEKWPLFGRFSAYLFLETVSWLLGCEILNASMDWENGATATSGLMNLYCYDSEADQFDKERILRKPFNQDVMQKMVEPLLIDISLNGGNNNITMVETSLCAYRKFFKGSRYNGYYLDRMLEEVIYMKKYYPNVSEQIFEIRKRNFDKKYLGELNGWNGIRKECKKLYRDYGVIM